MTEKTKERIAKIMARAGVSSRRGAEDMILGGRVTLNGKPVATPATFVTENDIIALDGNVIASKEETKLWKYYKPVGLITSHHDPEGRETVFENLPTNLPHVVSVGRLDINSEGLLLLTNNGKLAHYLENPNNQIERIYRVRVYGGITNEMIAKIEKGVTVDGIKYAPMKITIDAGLDKRNQWISLAFNEGKNREIRKVMESFGLSVSRLIRISYGIFELGELSKGHVLEVPRAFLKKHFAKLLEEIN